MRHTDAGLAIPDFPLAFGHLIPPVWNAKIAIHFAHRVGALIVTLAILATTGHVFYHHRGRRELVRPAFLLLLFLSMQVTLGAFVVWSGKDPVINTAHVVNGALVLGTSLVLTLRASGRFRVLRFRRFQRFARFRRFGVLRFAVPGFTARCGREVGRGGDRRVGRAARGTSSRWRSRG